MKPMTANDIKTIIPGGETLKRTDRFKRSIDLILAQGLPIEIKVAGPFKAFKSVKGKSYKVKIINTRTGEAKLILPTSIRKNSEYLSYHTKGRTFIGFTLEKVMEETGVQSDQVTEYHVYPNSEEIITQPHWSSLGLVLSRLFSSDVVTFETCGRCGGMGELPHFFHIAEGICFECLGMKGKIVTNIKPGLKRKTKKHENTQN